jgi:hypothetical protein
MNKKGDLAEARKSRMEKRWQHVSRARNHNRRPRVKEGQLVTQPFKMLP